MYKNKRVSVILPVYNEERGIKKSIDKFFATGVVDEVIAVDNNSRDNSLSEIKRTNARYVLETRQGYGIALRRGMEESTGDLIVTAEPDGTFEEEDIHKLLIYSDEFDCVFGTRTSRALIWSGAKMNLFLRYGNVFVAKLLEYLFNGPCLTDVGCTFKLIKREAYNKINKKFRITGSEFSPEFMLHVIKNRIKCVEIPINYKERIGDSKITNSFWKSFKLGWIMIFLIIKNRFIRN